MIDEKHNHTFYNNFSFKLLVIWQQLQFHEKCLYIVFLFHSITSPTMYIPSTSILKIK